MYLRPFQILQMKCSWLKPIVGFCFVMAGLVSVAQPPKQSDFLSFQKSFKTVNAAFAANEDSLKKQFEAKGLKWPARYMYIRSFKFDSQLEVWVKSDKKEKYRLFKTYKVCALAGGLGPKRLEGDYQVPEGFYYVNQFRPNSNYHLALGVNYPNPSDRVLADPAHPGGEIFVHGSCVTVGCIPLTDPMIEEVYVLASVVKNEGQDYIPIHVMPVVFKREKSREALEKFIEVRPDYEPLARVLEKAYYYFNEKKELPNIVINQKGEYKLLQDYTLPKAPPPPKKFVENTEPRKSASQVVKFNDTDFYSYVNSQPKYPGGLQAFQQYIDGIAEELSNLIPEGGAKRLYIDVDFVVDAKGNVVNVKVSNKANNEMNNIIIQRFESMPTWQPAMRQDKPVPMKLVQNIMVDAKPPKPKKVEQDADES